MKLLKPSLYFLLFLILSINLSLLNIAYSDDKSQEVFTPYDLFSQLEGEWTGRTIGISGEYASDKIENYEMAFLKDPAGSDKLIVSVTNLDTGDVLNPAGRLILDNSNPKQIGIEFFGDDGKVRERTVYKESEKNRRIRFELDKGKAYFDWIFYLDDSLKVNYFELLYYEQKADGQFELAQRCEVGIHK